MKTGRGPYRQKIKGWEIKTMPRLFRFKRNKEETWVDYCTRTCNLTRKMWMQMGLFFLYEKNRRKCVTNHGMGWVCDVKTDTMTMTHSEKSHIRRMKAWPYRQERRVMTPRKKNLFCWWSLLIGKVCKYKLLRTECNASSLEMNSKYKKTTKTRDHTGCYCAEFSISISQNPRIRSNNHTKKKGSQEGKTGQGNQEKQQHPERRSAGTHSAAVVPDSCPKFSFFGTKKFVHNNFIFVENPSRVYWPLLVNHREALNQLYCCCCLLCSK